jgi:hypothetical protein
MATKISWSMTAANIPGPVFTAYMPFYMRIVHTAGASTVALQQDINDDGVWATIATTNAASGIAFSVDGTHIIDVPEGCASKFRTMITTLSTGPVGIVVAGKLNLNDTIGGASGGVRDIFEENGTTVLDEDGTSQLFEENA